MEIIVVIVIIAVMLGAFGYDHLKKGESKNTNSQSKSGFVDKPNKTSPPPKKSYRDMKPTEYKTYEPNHKHVESDGVKTITVDTYSGSLGDLNDEGCKQHNDIRYIFSDEVNEDTQIDYAKIAKTLIIGEALSQRRSPSSYRKPPRN